MNHVDLRIGLVRSVVSTILQVARWEQNISNQMELRIIMDHGMVLDGCCFLLVIFVVSYKECKSCWAPRPSSPPKRKVGSDETTNM